MPNQGLLSQITRKAVSLAVINGIHQLADKVRANGGQPLDLILPDGSRLNFGLQPRAVMSIHDPDMLSDLAHPTLGALGEAFVDGRLDIDGDIIDAIASAERLTATGGSPATSRIAGAVAAHTPTQDRDDITHHYDVGNEFYGLWLDERLIY